MAEEVVESYMKEKQAEKRMQLLNKLIKGVLAKELSLVHLVETLGPYLTNQDADERCNGTQLLALVLHRLSSFELLEQEVNLLVDFFCDRLRDHYSVIPHVVSGLLALVSYQTIPSGLEVKIVQALFKDVHIQSLLQADRYNMYTLLSILLNNARAGLQSLGGEFVFGFMQAMDGEKDPRNLLVAFQLVQVIIRSFPIALFAEDLFEVTSCYFPIDFTPPANDPNAITREQLILALRNCLSGSSLFAPFCLPLLLDKLSSDIVYAKKDALLTIAACADVYDSRSMKEFLMPLWNNIRREILTARDKSIELAGYEAIRSIVRNISRAEQETQSGDLKEFLAKVLSECEENLTNPEHKLLGTSATLLQTIAAASDLACSQIIDQVLPVILQQYELHPQINNQKTILDALLGFLQVAKEFANKDASTGLPNHKEKLAGLFFSLMAHHNPLHRSSSIAGLVALTSASLLTNEEIVLFLDHLLAIILGDKEKIVRHEAKLALAYLSSEHPSSVKSNVVTQLAGKISILEDGSLPPENVDVKLSQNSAHLTHEYLITMLVTLCTSSVNVEYIVPHLVNDLRKWSEHIDDNKEENMSHALDGLQTIFDGSLRSSFKNADYFKDMLLPSLLELPMKNALCEKEECFTPELLGKFSKLVRSICSNISENSSISVVKNIQEVFLDKQAPRTGLAHDSKQENFDILKVSSPWRQTQLVIFLTATLCNISKSVMVPRLQEFLPKLLSLATHCEHKRTNIEAAKCMAGLINRMENETKVGEEVTQCLQALDPLLKQDRSENEKWRAAIVLIWITKALLVRGHSHGVQLLEKLLDLFSDQMIGQAAADGFFIIMSTPDDVMTDPSCANIKMLYKQRIFIQISPILTQKFHSSGKEHKHLYLCALSHVLHWLPKQVLLSEIPTILPLLVQSLSCEEESLQLSTMETFYSLTHDVPKIIAQYVTSLVPRFLRLAQDPKSLKIRSTALKCLGVLTVLPHHEVFPFKSQVVRTLAKCLDDHKRLVRKEAVKCRNEWILLGTSVD